MSNVRGPLLSETPQTPTVIGGVYNVVPPAPADQQGVALQTDNEGNLLVNINAGSITASNPSVGTNGVTAPTSSTEAGYRAATALPTAVSDGQLVGGMTDKFGRETVVVNAVRDLVGTFSVQSTAASPATLIGQIAGTYCDITELVITNESSTATIVSISDGTTTYKYAIAANGGLTKSFISPLVAASVNTNWTISNSAAVTLDVNGCYVKNK